MWASSRCSRALSRRCAFRKWSLGLLGSVHLRWCTLNPLCVAISALFIRAPTHLQVLPRLLTLLEGSIHRLLVCSSDHNPSLSPELQRQAASRFKNLRRCVELSSVRSDCKRLRRPTSSWLKARHRCARLSTLVLLSAVFAEKEARLACPMYFTFVRCISFKCTYCAYCSRSFSSSNCFFALPNARTSLAVLSSSHRSVVLPSARAVLTHGGNHRATLRLHLLAARVGPLLPSQRLRLTPRGGSCRRRRRAGCLRFSSRNGETACGMWHTDD